MTIEQAAEDFERCRDFLTAFVWRRVKDKDIARDIVQTTAYRIFNHFEKGKDIKVSIQQFAFTIAKNIIIDLHRRRSFQDVSLEEKMENEQGNVYWEPSYNPFEEGIDFTDMAYLHRMIDMLPPYIRRIFKAYYFDHLSLQEVSQKLNVKYNNVCVYLHRGVKMLQKLKVRGMFTGGRRCTECGKCGHYRSRCPQLALKS